jgi:aspartyl-tRNA(Asn)/glutamyl-tRNA(Gln) amidotransferase subunit B
VIGLEVHAQVTSNAKLFSGSATALAPSRTARSRWSTRRCPACCPCPTGVHPPGGAHRHGDRGADQQVVAFDRKNYFYADLPQGYQISQLYHPLVGEGEIEISWTRRTPRPR